MLRYDWEIRIMARLLTLQKVSRRYVLCYRRFPGWTAKHALISRFGISIMLNVLLFSALVASVDIVDPSYRTRLPLEVLAACLSEGSTPTQHTMYLS